jgi:hypothetical protein
MGQWLIGGARRAAVALSDSQCVSAVGNSGSMTAVLALLAVAARDADRPLRIHPPCAPELSEDEEYLARALEWCGAGFESRARFYLYRLIDGAPSAALLLCLRFVRGLSAR